MVITSTIAIAVFLRQEGAVYETGYSGGKRKEEEKPETDCGAYLCSPVSCHVHIHAHRGLSGFSRSLQIVCRLSYYDDRTSDSVMDLYMAVRYVQRKAQYSFVRYNAQR